MQQHLAFLKKWLKQYALDALLCRHRPLLRAQITIVLDIFAVEVLPFEEAYIQAVIAIVRQVMVADTMQAVEELEAVAVVTNTISKFADIKTSLD